MKKSVKIDNLKCVGCANGIQCSLKKIEGITNVSVDNETAEVSFESESDASTQTALDKLAEMGYPEAGTTTLLQKGKSYVSCMIGRMQEPAETVS